MTGSSRSLDNPINWSFPIGRVFGITIRLHLFFVLGAFWIVFNALNVEPRGSGPTWRHFFYGTGSAAMLFGIVLLHEFGHCFGARSVGGSADEILLWPLGGLAYVSTPHTPWASAVTAVAGPFVNLVFCAAGSLALIFWLGSIEAVPWNPIHPFTPVGPVPLTQGQGWLCYFFGLNYVLLLFNLLPVFPLDGGRMLQCVLWSRRGFREATLLASGIGMVGAISLGVVGLFTKSWMLPAIAVFGYLTCYQQRHMLKMGAYESENEFGYDFSQGYRSLDKPHKRASRSGWLARRRAARALARERRERARLADLQRHVDAILDKVHHHGIQSLTAEERRILNEATERQRAEDERFRKL